MKYIKLYENKKTDYIVLLPSGEILEVDGDTVDKIFYDNEIYNFEDFDLDWDYGMEMYKSEDKHKDEIIKRNKMFVDRMKEYEKEYGSGYKKQVGRLTHDPLTETFDWDDEDFDEDEMDEILGVDMYFITVKKNMLHHGWSNCLNVQKGTIKFVTRHITYPKHVNDRYKIPLKNRDIHRYQWIPKIGKDYKHDYHEDYMKELINNFVDDGGFQGSIICFSTKDKLYENLEKAISMTSKRIERIGVRYSNSMKNINIDELIDNIDKDNFKYYITGELKKK